MLSALRSVLTQGRHLLVAPHATMRWPTNHVSPVELGTNQLGMQQRWATKKAGGSSNNRKDSAGRRLGWKKSNGQPVLTGHILIRQRGLKYHPGLNVGVGTDHTLFAKQPGQVYYTRISRSWKKLRRKDRVYVNVVPAAYFHDPLYRYVRLAVDTYYEKVQADKYLAYRMRKTGVKLLSKTRLQVVAKRQANETVQRKIREANPVRLSASDAIRMIMATDTPQ